MEVTAKTLSESFSRYKMDEIPDDWYFPAKSAYSMIAQLLYHWKSGHVLKDGAKTADKALYNAWLLIEDKSISIGRGKEDEN